MTAEDFDQLLGIAVREATEMTAKTVADHALGALAGWSLDEAKARLLFADKDGRGAMMAAQVIGFYQPTSKTWEWAWSDASFTPHLVKAVQHVREWGLSQGNTTLTTPLITIDDAMAWKLAAFTTRFIDWPGVYRATGGPKDLFIAFAPTLTGHGANDPVTPASNFMLPTSMNG
ncbi:hypothetical protein BH11PLA2_BH11PLA2_18880 [soil metagenome]